MTPPSLHVRPARPDDAEAVARINIETWRTAYRGIVPDAYLDGTLASPEHLASRTESFHNRMAAGELYGLFVAEMDGHVVGFADGGRTRSPEMPFDGELYAIYVLQEHQRGGVGRALVGAVVANLIAKGLTSMLVWTLEANRHRSFYDQLGGGLVPAVDLSHVVIERAGVRLPLVAYGWPDLLALARTLDSQTRSTPT